MNDQSLGQFRDHRTHAWGGEWIGARKRQEDAHAIFRVRGALCCIVCDGMGGHAGGQIASKLAVEAARAALQNPQQPDPPGQLRDALGAANRRIGKEVQQRPDLTGMGATFVAVMVVGDRLHWISVGDSLLYQAGPGGLTRLNADHSLRTQLEEQARTGAITPEEARNHPNRNALTSAVMGDEITLYDLKNAPAIPGSRIIVASDGIETLPDAEIDGIARQHMTDRPGALGHALLAEIQARGKPGQDNLTVVVIDPAPASASPALPLYKRLDAGIWVYGGIAVAVAFLLLVLVFTLWGSGETAVNPAGEQAAVVCPADDPSDTGKQRLCTCVWENQNATVKNEGAIGQEISELIAACRVNGGQVPGNQTENAAEDQQGGTVPTTETDGQPRAGGEGPKQPAASPEVQQ